MRTLPPQAGSGTLSDKELEMLRHSFTLMAAGDDAKCGLLPHQLRELAVMAGLDPASHATAALVDALLQVRRCCCWWWCACCVPYCVHCAI